MKQEEIKDDRYYVQNLETGKLNIYFSKEYYQALDAEDKKVFTGYCLFSRSQGCWVSKGKAENCVYLKHKLNELGFQASGQMGEKISIEEKVRREQQRAAVKADRSRALAAKAEGRSDSYYERFREIGSAIPPGQPVLVGHHSEKRHRRDLERMDSNMRRSVEESDKAKYYQGRSKDLQYTAEGKKFQNPKYLNNRIKDCRREIGRYERALSGKTWRGASFTVTEDHAKRLHEAIKEQQQKLDFYIGHMKAIDPQWTEKNRQSRGKKL